MKKFLYLSILVCSLLSIPSSLTAKVNSGDDGNQKKNIRIFLNTGEIFNYEASEIDSITTTAKTQTIWYEGTSHTISLEDIDSIMYISPILMLTTKSLDFGKVEVDYGKTLPVTLTNTGDYPETYAIMTDGVFTVKNPYKELIVMAGQSVTIDLTFIPKDIKTYSTNLTIISNSAEDGKLSLPLSGEGVSTAAEEAEADIEPVEQEIEILLPEDLPLESFGDFRISNIYGEFSLQTSAKARGLKKIRRDGANYNACTANVPISSNGLQFHSFIDGWGNPYMFSISLPNEKPEISYSETAIALLMTTPDLITSNESEYRNVVKVIKGLKSFPAFVDQVRKIYEDAAKKNMCPDYSAINITPILNELYALSKDTRELRLSGVSLRDIITTPQTATFRLRNDFKRLIHAYTRRVKMNETNEAIVAQEEASPTLQEKLDELLDEKLNQAEETIQEKVPLLDDEDFEYLEDLKEWVKEIEERTIESYPALGKLFQFRLPYVLESQGIDYIDAVGDGFDAYVYGIGRETSIFEVESSLFEVPFKGYDKIFVDIYGVGLPGEKSWNSYTQEDKIRILMALVWGAYTDYYKPVTDLITGIKNTKDALDRNKKFKYDFRYGARKYPEWALLMKLYNAFMEDDNNVKKLINNLNNKDVFAILKQLSKFAWNELTKIPKESDNVEDKRTYTNLIYNIYKKYSGNSATSEEFRKLFKSEAKKFLGGVKLVFATMEASENVVDLIGAYKALKKSELKDTHIIDMYNHPNITMKEPSMVYLTHDVTIHFEWETYKSNTIGDYLYDLEMMTETPSGINQTVVIADIDGYSCDYDLNKLGGARDAMKIYFRIVAHNPSYSQVFVTTEFIPLVWRAKAEAPEMYDLGLPSGTLWAGRNLGAESNQDYGNYYAWGETNPKEAFSWKNYKYCNNGQQNALTKYNTKSNYGNVDNKIELDASDDMMKSNCGYYYAIPTKADWEELLTHCNWSRLGGLIVVRGSNNETIYLPLAGYRSGQNLYDAGKDGFYWSSTLDKNSPDDAWFLHINPSKHELNSYYRSQGRCIRPVMHKNNYKAAVDVRNAVMSTK